MNKKLLIGAALLFGAGVYYMTRKAAPAAPGTANSKSLPSGITKTAGVSNSSKTGSVTAGNETITFEIGDKVTIPPDVKMWEIRKILTGDRAMLSSGFANKTVPLSTLKKYWDES